MATTPVSALAFHGSSGAASGSSQSPNWNRGVPEPGRETAGSRRDARGWTSIRTVDPGQPGRRTPATSPTAPRRRRHSRSPWSRARGTRPGGGAVEHIGDDERHPSVGVGLLEGEVAQPVREEVLDVEEVGRGRREGCDVAGPARGARRAADSRWARRGSCPWSPHDVPVELVEQRLRALEPSGAFEVGVDDDGLQRRRR